MARPIAPVPPRISARGTAQGTSTTMPSRAIALWSRCRPRASPLGARAARGRRPSAPARGGRGAGDRADGWANATVSSTLEWPQPIRSPYSPRNTAHRGTARRRPRERRARDPVGRPSGIAPASAGSWSGIYAKLSAPSSSRNPTVGPGWTTSAPEGGATIVQGSRGTSWKVTVAGMSWSSTGKSGGEKARATRSARLSYRDGGPQMSSSTRSSQSGAKKRKPSRWSRWR